MTTPVLSSTDQTSAEHLVVCQYTSPEGVVVHTLWSQLPVRREVAVGIVGELNDLVSQPMSSRRPGHAQYIALRLGADDAQ